MEQRYLLRLPGNGVEVISFNETTDSKKVISFFPKRLQKQQSHTLITTKANFSYATIGLKDAWIKCVPVVAMMNDKRLIHASTIFLKIKSSLPNSTIYRGLNFREIMVIASSLKLISLNGSALDSASTVSEVFNAIQRLNVQRQRQEIIGVEQDE